MTDKELQAVLGLTDQEAAIVIPRLTPDQRATYQRLDRIAHELNLWTAGLGPKPENVLVCSPHEHRRQGRKSARQIASKFRG